MKILFMTLSLQFLSVLAYADYSVIGIQVFVDKSYCERYFDFVSIEESSLRTYELTLKMYNKQPEGSEKKEKYKLRLEKALITLNLMTELKLDHLDFPVATVKINVNQDILVPKDELMAPGHAFVFTSTTEDGLGHIILNMGLEEVVEVRGAPACEFFKQNGGDIEESVLQSLDQLLN